MARSQKSRSHRGGGGGLGGGGTKHSGHVAQARLVKAHCSGQLEPNAFVRGVMPPPHAQHMRLAVKSSSSCTVAAVSHIDVELVQPDTSISNRRKKSKAGYEGDEGLHQSGVPGATVVPLPSKRIALVSTGTGRMNVVSWPFCDSPGEACDQLVCASTVVHADVVRLCTCSSKPERAPSQLPSFWYTTIFSTSWTSGHESVTLLLGGTCRAVDGAHPLSPSVSTEQSGDRRPQIGSISD